MTRRAPAAAEMQALRFAWTVVKHVKSNAIVLAGEQATVGIGAGQMSRVDAVKLAIMKAATPTRGTVLASDAFFPFRDGVDVAAAAGVTAIIQPGGSVRDAEVIAAADEHGLAMVFTGIAPLPALRVPDGPIPRMEPLCACWSWEAGDGSTDWCGSCSRARA